jgi:hypothetical protein
MTTRKIDTSIPLAYAVSATGNEHAALLDRVVPKLSAAVSAQPKEHRYGALLLGPTGCGKSSAAAWAVQRWRAWCRREARAAAERDLLPLDAYDTQRLAWLDAIEATDSERRYRLGTGDPEELAEAYRADWLVLDDVGLSTSATLVQLVLARRYQACLPTIVTSGLTAAQLATHIGAASVRRIVEHEGKPGVFVDIAEVSSVVPLRASHGPRRVRGVSP